MALSHPAGQQQTERMQRTDGGHDCGNASVDTVPNVDVRVVLFTVSGGRLLIALRQQPAYRGLPCGSPIRAESLDATGSRILTDRAGIAERYLEQLYSISHCSEGDWTMSVTYIALALAGAGGPPASRAAWFDAANLPEMSPVDRRIVDYALLRLRAKLGYTTIAFHLLPPSFSLSELQKVYEAVLGHKVDKRNFRRRIHAAGVLEETQDTRREGSHRPARLYRLRAADNAETYLTPDWAFDPQQGATDP